MQFDQDNNIVKLCARGMDFEGQGKKDDASALFKQAWEEATNDFEKYIAAHYVARHQPDIAGKLKWDEIALNLALTINNEDVKGSFPSLYLNVAKCYEDLNDFENAKKNYELALSCTSFLNDDGYGKMIRAGISAGIERTTIN